MSRHRKRRRSHDDGIRLRNRLGWLILVLCGVAAVALFWWHRTEQSAYASLDPDTLCPGSGPVAVTAVLIDRTDTLNPVQREAIRRALQGLKGGIVENGLLELYSVGPTDDGVREPIAALCNPGRDASPISGNPRFAERRWREGFDVPLEQIFGEVVRTEGASRSPIMESIQSVAVTAFGGSDGRALPKALILVSDMLQHTDGASHYRGLPTFGEFRSEPFFSKVRADLRGVHIEIFYVRRQTRALIQGKEHVQFWRDYLVNQGGVVTLVDRIEG